MTGRSAIKPYLAEAWLGRGNACYDLKRYDEAFAAYDRAMSIKPDLEGLEGVRLYAKTHLCRWDRLEEEIAHLTTSRPIGQGKLRSVCVALAFRFARRSSPLRTGVGSGQAPEGVPVDVGRYPCP